MAGTTASSCAALRFLTPPRRSCKQRLAKVGYRRLPSALAMQTGAYGERAELFLELCAELDFRNIAVAGKIDVVEPEMKRAVIDRDQLRDVDIDMVLKKTPGKTASVPRRRDVSGERLQQQARGFDGARAKHIMTGREPMR